MNSLPFSIGTYYPSTKSGILSKRNLHIIQSSAVKFNDSKSNSGRRKEARVRDRVIGSGAEAVKGQLIKAHYIGKCEDGKVFDSSYNRGKPLSFRIGVGEVIKGWDVGILGGEGIPPMLAGGKRKLRIPPALGYGSRGAGCRGDSVLLFDVELIGKA